MRTRLPILTYHAIVTDEPRVQLPAEASLAHAVRAADFCAQLDLLCQRKWQTVLPDRLAGPVPDRTLMITFDDGYESHRFAADELIRRGLRAVFYVTWSNLGKNGYLTHSEVRDLRSKGFEIGSHSLTHTYLTRLNDGDLEREVSESKERLEDLVGGPVDTIAIPYGAYDRRVLASAFAAGYARVTTSDTGLANAGSSRVSPRLTISASTTLAVFESSLTAGTLEILRCRIVRGATRHMRRLARFAAPA
jgi:peptidoglycan/xylan/chitin deacetylase (PgdA/CDA1 family)